MASSNSVIHYGNIVEWNLQDTTSKGPTTSTIAWYSSSCPPTAKTGSTAGTPSTETYWMVKTITFIPSVASATGGYVRLMEKDSSGPVLFSAYFETALDIYSQTYNPPLRCRPIWWSTLGDTFTTGSKWIFHLA